MTVDEALKNVDVLGMDTSPFIYFIEGNVNYFSRAEAIIQRCRQRSLMGVTSILTLTETLVHPLRSGDAVQAADYQNLLIGSANIASRFINEFIALRAAELRAQYRMKTPDAIQLATAILADCDAFLTNDRGFERVTEIPVLILDDLTL